ncbi:glyoxalase superfamily protein [Undibacterium sp. TS12]|uniref:glyoxalase superfamily protein n=1 Tax=Undibacterium sp. TS12 TaxID=2908202 RepID=UPI001F4CC5C1|nr:glyoxalase superfamily protein [Undibacterium sp. TS12]MCH8620385.1 glyoxalase superfamily protein [Undibacterium sp. TS12]
MKPIASTTVLQVSNFSKSLHFYTEILGFELDFKYGEPECYAGLSWGSAYLHIGTFSPYKDNTGHGVIYLTFEEVDSIYKRLVKADVQFYSHIADQDYGMRDFSVKDPDGNQIGFGASIA